jgi:putative membrane protein
MLFPGGQLTIRNFSDHAANERTFLAWVRTAIAMMGFGFVIERFDLFLRATPVVIASHTTTSHNLRLGELAGLAVMLAGLATLVVAVVRFVRTSRMIDDTADHKGPGEQLDIALASLLLIVGVALFGYMIFSLAVP